MTIPLIRFPDIYLQTHGAHKLPRVLESAEFSITLSYGKAIESLFAQEGILCNKTKLEKEDHEAALRFVGERENKTQYLVS